MPSSLGTVLLTITLIIIKIIRPSANVMVDWTQHDQRDIAKETYNYGYEIEDVKSNNYQFKNEKRESNGSVTGSYGFLAFDGSVHLVHYIADKNGYRAKVERGVKDNNLNQRGFSKQLLDILRTKDVYKKQRVYEQRLRPFDLLTEKDKKRFRT